MASKTPRTTVKDYLQNVSTEVAQKVLRRRSETKLPDAVTGDELEQGSSSGKKQGLKGRAAGQAVRNTPQMGGSVGEGGIEETGATPRHIIQSMLMVQGTAQPVTRRKQQMSDVIMRPPVSTSTRRTARRRSSVSSGLDFDDVTKKFTPRTNVLGFLEQAPEVTPAVRQTSAITDSHSTTQNVSSCFTVNEVGVTLLEGNTDVEVNVSARGGRFRSKKRNLNIQLPELSPQVMLKRVPDSTLPSNIPQSGNKDDVNQDLNDPPPPDSQPPSIQPAEKEGSTAITSRSAGKNTLGDIANALVVTEADKTTTNEGNADSADALNSSAEEGRSRTNVRNVFSDVFGGSGNDGQAEAEVNESLPRQDAEREVEAVQGGDKGQTPSFSGREDSERRSSIQGTPRSGRVISAMGSQTTLEALWTQGKIPELTEGKAGNEGINLSKSGQSMRTLHRSIRNVENITDATPASAVKRAENTATPSVQDSPSSANRSKKQEAGNTSLSQADGLVNSSRSQTLHSPHMEGFSRGGPQSSAQKGSSLKKKSSQKILQLSGNLSMSEGGLGESPVPSVFSRNTPLTSTPRESHPPPPVMPTPGTSSSHKSAAFASRRSGRTPGSASSRGRGGSAEKNLQSSLQRQSRSSAVSRLSSRFDAMDSTPASAESGGEDPPGQDMEERHLTTDMLPEADHNHQMPDLMDELPDQEENSSDEDDEEYSPLKTPKLPPKPSTPATVAPRSANRKDKNSSTTVGAPRAGVKRKAVTAPRSAKKPRSGLPTSVIKTLFGHFCHLRVSKEAIAEVERLSEQYWANMAEDLEAYATHAHRHTINESDVELLMKRQGFITDSRSLNTLIAKYLPLELRQELIPIARSGNALQPKVRH